MKIPSFLVTPDGEINSFGELRSYLRAVRYDTAKKWAARKSRAELEHIVSAMFARSTPWAGIPNSNERKTKKIYFQMAMKYKKELEQAPVKARKEVARKAAAQRVENDPKQQAKVEARRMWEDWQEGRTRHKSGAAFARYVVNSIPIIESEETVKRWDREWRKETKPK